MQQRSRLTLRLLYLGTLLIVVGMLISVLAGGSPGVLIFAGLGLLVNAGLLLLHLRGRP